MRKIQISKWKVLDHEGKELRTESLLDAINVLIVGKKLEDIPRGIDKYRLFGRLGHAFDKAEKEGVLVLEEADYSFLRKTIEDDIPSVWAMNKDINGAIEAFLNAKEE
jgi:hypothetical protein